jgi:succinyl-diaminopimelate desuccinylase
MVETLKQLIKFQTYDDNPNLNSEIYDLYKYVVNKIPDNYKYKIYRNGEYDSLVVYKNQAKYSKVVLQAHIDVVSAPEKLFTPHVKNEKLYGRGASDMKFAVAAYIKLLNDFKDSPLDIAMWLTPDEEIGGKHGTAYLLNKLGFKTDIAILPDGHNDNCLVTKTKGVLHFKWTSHGVAAHGAEPWLGKNAIDHLITAYNELRGNRIFTKYGNEQWRNTISIGAIKGGHTANVIADLAEAKIDVRFISNSYSQDIRRLLKQLSTKYKMDFQELSDGFAFELNRQDPLVGKFFETLKNLNIDYKLDVDHGSSDATYFAENNIQTIIYKPICGGDHSNEEWIDINSLWEFYKLMKEYLKSIY